MKLVIQEDAQFEETEILITCREIDDHVLRIAAGVRALEHKLVGQRGGKTFMIDQKDAVYFESVDKRTFLYTSSEVYETPLRLYEIEERCAGGDFFRAGKSVAVNLAHVRALSPMLGGRIEIELDNGEKQMVSRQYAAALKQKLGLKG